jgi:hypothetical protein
MLSGFAAEVPCYTARTVPGKNKGVAEKERKA